MLTPFIFHCNSTEVPSLLPKLTIPMNLVPTSVFAVGWALSALVSFEYMYSYALLALQIQEPGR